MSLAPKIETARLVLRKPALSDAEAVFSGWASDSQATRFMSWPRHSSLTDTLAFLEFALGEWDVWPAGPYVIELASTGRLVGSCGFGFRSASVAEVGYILAPEYWHQGLATEALAAQLDAARVVAPLRVTSSVHPRNTASLRVLEKCGFVPDAALETQAMFPNLEESAPEPALCFVRMLDRERRQSNNGIEPTAQAPYDATSAS